MGDATTEPHLRTLEIATRSGSVEIWARAVSRPEVLSGSAEIQPDGVVRARGSERVEIACPEGSDLIIGTSSGRIDCHGRLGRVAVTGSSARISIEEATLVEVRSSSGRVTIGRCDGACRVVVSSGAVEIDSAGSLDATVSSGRLDVGTVGDALVRSGSGRVALALAGPSAVDIATQSGRVTVSVPADVSPQMQLASRVGHIEADVESGTDGSLSIATSSGRIKVTRS